MESRSQNVVLSKVGRFEKTAVASEHVLASRAGMEVMKKGGNAVDAAFAVGFTLAVVQPQLGGIGGDFFALIRKGESGKTLCINSSGWSPAGFSLAIMRERRLRSIPTLGPFSVVVPGLVRGLFEIQSKLGTLETAPLIEGAIHLAETGFPVSRGLARSIRADLQMFPDVARRVFAHGGSPPDEGDMLVQKSLGRALRTIKEEGPDAFYEGWIAEAIVEELSSHGSPLEGEDLSEFVPEWVTPLMAEHDGASVWEIPPNSMGATTLLILKELQEKDLKRSKPNSRRRVEATVKAVRFAYARRDAMLGDPRFTEFDLKSFLDPLEHSDGSSRRPPGVEEADTTYFAVADSKGNVVSAIQSLFHHFGSKVYVGKGGFFLNNRGSAFRTAGPNKVEPRKRPLHTLSSLLVDQGDKVSALGTSGGDFRPQQHSLFLTNLLDYSMTLEESIDFPRFLRTSGQNLIVESGIETEGLSSLIVKHLPHPGSTGVAHGVEVSGRGKKAVCDVRGDGMPAGF
jgi:gamma-glutamyltranspeptidase/glutathione hydrolase